MGLNVKLTDGTGSGTNAKVSEWGILATGPIQFSSSHPLTVNAVNTAFNFVPPISGHHFVVTDILLYADKNVGANDATVEIYEANSASGTVVTKTVLLTEMVKKTNRDLTGLNLLVSKGKWLNIKTDDDIVYASVLGYYVPVELTV